MIWKNFYKRIVFLLLSKAEIHAQTLKNTQIVLKSFIKTLVLSILPSFLYRDNNKPISQVHC